MEYRNIDNDYKLYHHTTRFYNKELSKIQLIWILKDANYSESEINQAINDYYEIHIRTTKLINYFILGCISILLLVLLMQKVML